ncbi:MAG: RHS repeat-associated core domain-containing protein, partial [Waddliaceae bacterium]
MKKSLPLFVTLFLFITFQVDAAPPLFGTKLLPSTESDPDSFIDHKVNVINGDYCEVATDLIIKGPDDLVMQRYYSNSNYITGNGKGGWRIFPQCWLTVGKDPKGNHCHVSGTTYHRTYAYTGERSGSILTYSGWESRTSKDDGLQVRGFRDGRSLCNTARGEVSGQANVQNNLLRYQTKNQSYTLKLGDGTERYFEKVDNLPSLCLGEELNIDVSEKVKDPEYFRLKLEILPSGNKVRYHYDDAGHLTRVELLNISEEKVFSWITLSCQPEQLMISTSDERNITYELDGSLITRAEYSYQPSCLYTYSDKGKLAQKILPGRTSAIEYDANSRVICLKEQLRNSNELFPSKTFSYESGLTEVINAIGQKTIYRFNKRDQLEAIEHYDLAGAKYRVDRKFWDSERERYGRILTKTIEDGNGNTISARCYSYDERGNVTEEFLYGKLTGKNDAFLQMDKNGQVIAGEDDDCHVKKMEYSQDGFNLITAIGDCKGNETIFEYAPDTNRMIRKYVKDNKKSKWEKIQKRTFYTYNDDGVLIETFEDDGHNIEKKSNYGVSERHITAIIPRNNFPGIGLPEEVVTYTGDPKDKFTPLQLKRVVNTYDSQGRLLKEDTYDANNSYCYTKIWEYDAHGNLTKEIDDEVHKTLYSYDPLGNCTSKQIPHQNLTIQFLYNKQGKIIKTRESYGSTQYVVNTTYDLLGRLLSSTDRLGNRTDYEYDLRGFLSKVIHPAMIDDNGTVSRPEESYENDLFGNPLITTDPRGYQLNKRYNLRGNPISIDYPDGTYELFKYDLEGSLHRHLTRDKIISVFEYDFLGRQVNEERSTLGSSGSGSWIDNTFCKYSPYHLTSIKEKGSIICYEYDGAGRPSKIFRPSTNSEKDDENSRKEEYSYDSLGRVAEKKIFFDRGEDNYILEHTEYDLGGRIVEKRIEDSKGVLLQATRFIYDEKGLLVEEQALPDGQYLSRVKTDYNELGEPILITDAGGRETHFIYETILDNASQNVLKKTIIDPSGVSTEMQFDAFHRMTSLKKVTSTGELLSAQSITYDLAGNKVSEENHVLSPSGDLEGQRTSFVIGPMNRTEEIHEAVGTEKERITYHTFGEDGKLASKLLPGIEAPVTYTYNKEGRLYKIYHKSESKDPDVSNTYSYDKRGNITSAHSLHGKTITRKYNAFDEAISETIKEDGSKYTVEYEYDRKGRITRILLPDDSTIKYSYDALHGKSISRISPSGNTLYTHEYSEYDEWDRLKEERFIGFSGQKKNEFNLAGQPILAECDFYKEQVPANGYDAIGNLLHLHREGEFEPSDLSYTYNLLSQVTSEKGEAENRYSYDSIGNRLTKKEEQYHYDALNQLLNTSSDQYAYTLQGTVSERTRNGQKWNFESNILGQLIHIKKDDNTLIEFSYDPFGRRLSKKHFDVSGKYKKKLSSSAYLYIGTQEVGRLDENGNIFELRIPGLSQEVLAEESIAFELRGKTVVPLYDMRGNVVALIDPQCREVVESYTYSAFGEQRIFDAYGNELEESHYQNLWGYSGKREDQESGFILIGHRYYDPEIGRWISPDPAFFVDGPNLYAFSQNNPLHYLDRFGLNSENRHSEEFEDYFYGEVELHCFCERHRTCKRGGDLGKIYSPEAALIKFLDDFEDCFENKSRIYDLSSEKEFQTLSKGMILLNSGIDTAFEEAKNHARYLARLSGGYNIHGVYNATHGKCVDAMEYLLNKDYFATPPIRYLHKKWDAFFANADSNVPLLQICHSQGAAQVRNALMCYPK